MLKGISTCIICKGDKKNLYDYTSQSKDLGDEVIMVSASSEPNVQYTGEKLGVPVSLVLDNTDIHKAIARAVEQAQGEWILVLKSDENISPEDFKQIRDFCNRNEEQACFVISQRPPDVTNTRTDPSKYEWVGNFGKYSSPEFRKQSDMSFLEVRLFKKNLFKELLLKGDGSFYPVFRENVDTIPISNIRIKSNRIHNAPSPETSEEKKDLQDYRRFVDKPEEDLSRYEGFEFLSPANIGYSLLDEEDYPSLIAGLEMGWGRVEILKFMLHDSIEKGAYDKAIDLATTITAKLGDHLEIWRLKGSAFFYQLDLINAEACYRRALSLKKDDVEILFNLAKVLIVSGRFDEAKKTLSGLRNVEERSEEISIITSLLEEKQNEAAKLSLLMLCRDEERYVGRALESVKDVVDEIVFVDTGSKDGSMSIARDFGAKVIEHPWNDHFGEARNAGLKHITGDYVLWMDADEFIDREAQIALLVFKNLLPLRKKKAVAIDIENYKEEQNSPNPLPPERIIRRTAIFPRLPGIRFSGRIFESVDESLVALKVECVLAKDIHFLHISDNANLRKRRKQNAVARCALEPIPPEDIFKGILYWLDLKNVKKAGEWFKQAVSEIKNEYKYNVIIGHFANTFARNGYLKINSPIFETLLVKYQNSYPIMSLCAHMLYRAGSYGSAAKLFDKLLVFTDNSSSYLQDKKTRLNNLIYCVAANLESDNFKTCEKLFGELAHQESMYDALQALLFYSEIRKRDIQKGIAILDSWIRHRKLPINMTINNFLDLINVITRIAEIMMGYGQIDATNFLSRSGHYLAETINLKE